MYIYPLAFQILYAWYHQMKRNIAHPLLHDMNSPLTPTDTLTNLKTIHTDGVWVQGTQGKMTVILTSQNFLSYFITYTNRFSLWRFNLTTNKYGVGKWIRSYEVRSWSYLIFYFRSRRNWICYCCNQQVFWVQIATRFPSSFFYPTSTSAFNKTISPALLTPKSQQKLGFCAEHTMNHVSPAPKTMESRPVDLKGLWWGWNSTPLILYKNLHNKERKLIHCSWYRYGCKRGRCEKSQCQQQSQWRAAEVTGPWPLDKPPGQKQYQTWQEETHQTPKTYHCPRWRYPYRSYGPRRSKIASSGPPSEHTKYTARVAARFNELDSLLRRFLPYPFLW